MEKLGPLKAPSLGGILQLLRWHLRVHGGAESQCGDRSSESPGTQRHTQLESGASLTAISA